MDDSKAKNANGILPGFSAEDAKSDSVRIRPKPVLPKQVAGHLVYDIDPNQLPTETISRGGHRIFLDETGNLREGGAEGPSHYEVIDKISEGGMGLVFTVKENSLKREVALKICRLGANGAAPSPQAVEEFTNEAYMTARLDHPGVVPIYALAKDADGRPFFAMKKVSGTSWKELLHPDAVRDPARRAALEERAGAMTWKDHFGIWLKVCDAVAYAHSKGILHRDLKPDNVMLGDFGEVYVMDWGLAMYFDGRNEYRRFPDLKPQLAGTPHYIAPEMVRGEMTALGPASDVYLLGGILYEILVGRPPHEGQAVQALLKQVATGSVPPPETVRDSPAITPALSRIVMKALAPRIADRYPTVPTFQQEIREYLANSESMAVCRRAAARFEVLRQDLAGPDGATPKAIDRDAAAIHYGKLSECIGGFRQALDLRPGNEEARRGLLDALSLQIRLAVQQDDLTLARAQLRALDQMGVPDSGAAFGTQLRQRGEELAAQIAARQQALNRAARQARGWKAAAAALALLGLAGLVGIAVLSARQRALALQNEQNMFAASVAGRAQMLEQFLANIEQIAMLYRQTAVELAASPAERLPYRDPTPAGRDGFYFDEDYYDPATQPPDLAYDERYRANVSIGFPTVVRSPWARADAQRGAVVNAAARLGRLNAVFAQIHRTRDDIQWSLAGSEAGLLVGFPGFGRYRDKPDYDATRRTWYRAAIGAPDDRPVWGTPYADASTGLLLMSCMCRIQAAGRTIGVVGLEITLENIQTMLLDFSQSLGGKRRCLLVRPFEETDAATGRTEIVPRVVVDTLYPRSAADWQAQLEMDRIETVGADVAAYYREILAGKHAPGTCRETGNGLMAFAPLPDRHWTLIAVLERGAAP